jgi:hypothetical protein
MRPTKRNNTFFLEQCEDKLYAGGHRRNAAGGGRATGRGGGDRGGGDEASLAIEQALANELQAIQSAITQVSFDTILGLFCTSIKKLS